MSPTLHSYRNYVFRIEYDADNPAYIVDFPDIPNIITSGSTLSEAFDHDGGPATFELKLHSDSSQDQRSIQVMARPTSRPERPCQEIG